MNLSRKSSLFFLSYILSTTLFFISVNLAEFKNKNLSLFFTNTDIKFKIQELLALDPYSGSVLLPRLFHNKIIFSIETFFNSIFQAIDPVFLFSLSKDAPLYTGPGFVTMLLPLELPLFIIAVIYIVRSWKTSKFYLYLFYALLASLFVVGFFLPVFHPIKLLPLVVVIRLIIFLGLLDFLKHQKWSKKYFS